MTIPYSNPRLAAIPCERMRGCSFAEDFVTETRMEDNNASVSGGWLSDPSFNVDHGLTVSASYIDYDIISQPSGFSVVIKFSSSYALTGRLISNADLIAGTPADGFTVWVDATGVRANHSNGVAIPTRCSVDITYTDGETHTVTYVVDMVGGTHSLYVDALAVDSVATTINEEIGTTTAVSIGDDYGGSLYNARIFDAVLTESEHDIYHAGTLTSFMDQPLAVYRCDDICNDTEGHKIWDRTLNLNDLYKGDRTDSATFPTFNVDKYLFDLSDDYVANLPTLPSTYTVSAALSLPQNPFPYIDQSNDGSLTDLLTTSGDHWGYLHNLILFTGQLPQLQLYHAEYQQLYWLWRGRAYGAYNRLITEGTCKLAMFLDSNSSYRDYSYNNLHGAGHGVTLDGANGATFPNADSRVDVQYGSGMQITDGAIAVHGTLDDDTYAFAGTMVDRGTDYKFYMSTGGANVTIYLNTSALTVAAADLGEFEQLAVVFRTGELPRFFRDGTYLGSGHLAVTPAVASDDLTIGNNNEYNDRFQCPMKQVYIGDEALTDAEIYALYEQARMIGAYPMEAGARGRYRFPATAGVTDSGAIDEDFDPGSAFQVIDVEMELDGLATTSEDMAISTVYGTDIFPQHTDDLSVSSKLKYVWRLDKRFNKGEKINIVFPNTETNAIYFVINWQEDNSVG